MRPAERLAPPLAGPAPVTPRRRPRLGLALAVLVFAGPALGLLGWLGLRQRVGDLEARLVRDANATFTAPRPRPAHAPARPGTFGDAAARHLPAIQAEYEAAKADEPARELARAIAAGDRPFADLPPRYRDALDRLRPALDGLLDGTRAERADLAPGANAAAPAPGADWLGVQHAVLLAAVDVRGALADGDAARASARCLDALALARDAAVTGMLVGRMVGVAAVGRLAPPCTSALAALPPAARREEAAALRTIAAGIPPLEETMRQDGLAMELLAFGQVMSPPGRAALAPEAAAHLASGPAYSGWQRLLVRDAWRSARALLDRQLLAYGLPAGPREAALKAALDEARKDPNPIPYVGAPDFSRYARRSDAAMLRLDALLLVAAAADHRDATGAWPERLEALPAGALREDELARLAPAAGLAVRGEALEVTIRLPRGTDDDAAAAVFRVAPRRRQPRETR